MTYYDIPRLRLALGDLVVQGEATHHATATLRIGRSKSLLEDTLYKWVARVNRRYMGRNWYREDKMPEQMWGIVFFEYGRGRCNPHAHIILRPPVAADPLHFENHAPNIFAHDHLSPVTGVLKPLAVGGTMLIQRIRPGTDNLRRIAGYDTKEMEFRPQAYEEWKLLRDLSPTGGI